MSVRKVLIANRGEVAVRIARSARELGLKTVAIAAIDDAASAHVVAADEAVMLKDSGPRAYLDVAALVDAAAANGADALHPGYGFLSESDALASACAKAGVIFVGPSPETLRVLGDKAAARALAARCDVPLLAGIDRPISLDEALAFFDSIAIAQPTPNPSPSRGGGTSAGQPSTSWRGGESAVLPSPSWGGVGGGGNGGSAGDTAMMIKAVAGGGGRGIRLVTKREDIADAFARCGSEALKAFGSDALYVEQAMLAARHIEVQIVGDGTGAVAVLGERECTMQRRHQKLIEIAPAPALDDTVRRGLHAAAARMAEAVTYKGLGTFEFLVDANPAARVPFAFIEANARLQVEHTVTEEIFGLDLVALQFRIASGDTLHKLGLGKAPQRLPGRIAMQLRVNSETMLSDGSTKPAAGTIERLRLPGGPGVRVDTHAYDGYTIEPVYDSLLAKIIVSATGDDYAALYRKGARALDDLDVTGLATNASLLSALLASSDLQTHAVTTRYIDSHVGKLVDAAAAIDARRRRLPSKGAASAAQTAQNWATTESTITSPLPGSIVSVAVEAGATVARGATLAIIESMKMEHVITAPHAGMVTSIQVTARDVVREGQPLLELIPGDYAAGDVAKSGAIDLDHIRPDLQAFFDRIAMTDDASRPEAISKRRKLGMRTARENVADLLDPDSFIEYGALAVAAQRTRRSLDDLMKNTPADGLITGIGTVNAATASDPDRTRVAVMAYDYTVLAGTQGTLNHKKSDRLLELVAEWKLPVALFSEGGGGRPGDTDKHGVSGLDTTTFHRFARLSGMAPRVGINAGRCFAGNAALLGSADVIIATENSSIGMGGPAMIEGGGLGVVAPDDVGPVSVMNPNGVIDLLVADEREAVAKARQYLSYFQGPVRDHAHGDQRTLRHVIPENRLRVYEIRDVIDALFDTGSVLELRSGFGVGAITALARIDGKPVGVIANNPKHLGGAIDAPACDKLARFLQLCDAFALPVVSLCDTPGFMVGVESEKTAMVRKTSRLFIIGSTMRVPVFTVILRKGYGLGAQAMAAGNFHAPLFTVSWPTGEFGPMGLEGAVRLGFRKELEAAPEGERERLFQSMVAKSYERGKATNVAAYLEIDAVIDPADTRRWILRGMASMPSRLPERRAIIDAW